MILETMDLAEVAREFETDLDNVSRYIHHVARDKKYAKVRMKHPNEGMLHFKSQEWTSPRKNKYILLIDSPSRKHFKEHGCVSVSPVCLFRYRGGLYAITYIKAMTEDVANVQILTDHFFQRYNERYLHKPLLTKTEVILEFFEKEMGRMMCRSVFDPKTGREEKICLLKHGCAFLEKEPSGVYGVYRTFVVGEQLYDTQNTDVFLQEAFKHIMESHKDNDLKMLQRVADEKIEIETAFRAFRVMAMSVKFNHTSYHLLSMAALKLHDIIKDALATSENLAFRGFGNHLLTIGNTSDPKELEALVAQEGRNCML